ncbi:ABC transporter substrate-binding protein [Nostoc sp. CHAB 5715]|uniref:ABC transporter substrate-binding protein n=1 Tax=Nostoc sp. CHAB 5715 TaxID=2780400 RepID=UPI001E581EE8
MGVSTWQWQRGSVAKERISFGEKSLIQGNPSLDKKAGIKEIEEKRWDKAQSNLEKSLEKNPNDPEARIFFNNAKIGSDDNSYTIAVSVPIRNNIDGSLEILRGVSQAQNEFNSSRGKSQWRLKVAIASDDNNPEVAQDVATALVINPDVLGVVGHYASDVTIAAKNIYTSKKLVAITPISTSVDLTKNSDSSKNSKPYIFRTVPSDSDSAKALGDYMFNKLNTNNNVAIFYNSSSNYSKSLKSEFMTVVKNKGGQVSKEFDLNEQDFNADLSVKQVIDKGTQVLMLAADTNTLPQAQKVVVRAAKKNLNILAGDDVYTPDTLKVGDAAVEMVVAAFWHIDNAPNSNFVNKSKELWGGATVNWRTALAYDATQALIDAIQRAPTRSEVQQFLSSGKFKTTGASGDIEFCPSGDRKNPYIELVKIVSTNSSDNLYKFVPVEAYKDKPSSDCPVH